MTTQPDALRLADLLDDSQPAVYRTNTTLAAAELRRLHKANQTMLAALKQAMMITAYAAGGMTHADWMTKRAKEAHDIVWAAINSVEDGK